MPFNRIELLGCSGIGKTTLLHAVMRQRSEPKTWLTLPEALLQTAHQQPCSFFRSPLQALMILALRYNLLKGRQQGLAYHILRSGMRTPEVYGADCHLLLEMVMDWVRDSDRIPSHHRITTVDFYQALLRQYGLLEAYGVKALVVDDEGLIMNNPGLADPEVLHNLACNSPGILARLAPKGIICCHTTLEITCQRRQQRASEGRGTYLDQGQTEESLMQSCRLQLNSTLRKAELWAAQSVPVLEVDMARPVTENTGPVLHFIQNIAAGIAGVETGSNL